MIDPKISTSPQTKPADKRMPLAKKRASVVKKDNLPPSTPSQTAPNKTNPMQKTLQKMGLQRDIDMALHLPLRYEDETRITPLRNAREGDVVQIEATVVKSDVELHPRRQLVVTVMDGDASCVLRFFSFYPSQQKTMSVGAHLRIRGEVKGGFWGRQMLHPTFRLAGGELPQSFTPVYPTVASMPQAYLRRVVQSALRRADLSETLPRDLNTYPSFTFATEPWSLRQALQFLHHPTPDVALSTLEDKSHPAWQRLKAEELLAQQLSQLQAKRKRDALRAPLLRLNQAPNPAAPNQSGNNATNITPASATCATLYAQLLAVLPFQLTAAQQRVCQEIEADLQRPAPETRGALAIPMHRLLQGDVGSGKTIVAALAATICIDAGWQCALMAPTEILAEQHFRKLISWLEPLLTPRGKCVAWLTGSQKKKERTAMLALIASGEAALVVGTHAVIQAQVQFRNLALAIIDEQHRFGVAQRLALRQKLGAEDGEAQYRGQEPHLLMMTATPIPRTLAMSYYADLNVSTIDELPPGRTPIVTKLVADSRRAEVIARIRQQLEAGRQVYWVCPLIEESEVLDLTNATQTHADLCEALQADVATGQTAVTVGLLHSRMGSADKKAIMQDFVNGTMGVLVSTTVIEVGVDVPNASLMVIEHAERFGLSQLHQLRGRVGRGAAASACILLYSVGDAGRLSETARARLKAMLQTNDGFEIARRDLEIRGPGEFLGARQSGAPLLRFADLETDINLLEWARECAPQMLNNYPELAQQHVLRWLGGKEDYLKA